jgi:tetratricopeptide (TPR) repeat protein
MSLNLSCVTSHEKHYGPFVCQLCTGLVSLDAVVTACNHPFCRNCLKLYLQKSISENSICECPTCREDLHEPNEGKSMVVVEDIPIRASSLKFAQPLAYSLLLNVQVKCGTNGSAEQCFWVGDYQEHDQHLHGHTSKAVRSPGPGIPKPSSKSHAIPRGVSAERLSVYEDDVSRAGTTTRGEPTAAHHLRSLPQHAERGQVNLPELERAMSRCDKLKKQANAKFNRGDIEGARLLYSEGLALISDFPIENDDARNTMASLYSNRAVTFFRERILPQSMEDCDKSLQLDPTAEKTYIRKWRTLAALGEMELATACLRKGLEFIPNSTKLQEELRRSMAPPATTASSRMADYQANDAYSIASQSKMSAAGYEGLGAGDPSPAVLDRCERLKKQANAKFNKGEIEAARALYSDALGCIPPGGTYSHEITSSLSMLYSNRAVTFFRDKMYQESLADCEKAVELDPLAEKCYIRKSRALIGLERKEEAYRCLKEAIKKLPNSKKITEEMRKGDFDKFGQSSSYVEKKSHSRDDYDGAASTASLDFNSSVGSFNYFIPPSPSKGGASKSSKKTFKEDYTEELELADKLKRNANAKFNRGDTAGARLLYTEALGCLPDDHDHNEVRAALATLYANRAVTFFREKEFGPSVWDCDKAIELDPESEKSYIRKARALASLLRLEDTVTCLEQALRVLPDSSRLKDELAKTKEQLANGGSSGHTPSQNDSVFQMSVAGGMDASQSSPPHGTAFMVTPKDARSILGSVAEGSTLEIPFSGDEDLERVEKLKKQANAKLNKGDVGGARQLYGEALDCLPLTPDTLAGRELAASLYANRAVTYFREKKFAATVIDCDKSLDLDPKHDKSYIRKWRALMALGSFDDAYKCLEDAVIMIPDSRRLEEELEAAAEQKDLLTSVNVLIDHREYEDAREMLLPLVKTSDNVSLWLAAARADAYLGLTDSALERVNKVLMFNPKHLEGLQVRGYALFLSGEMEQGVTMLKDSLEVDIDNAEVSSLLQNCQRTFSGFCKGQARVKRGRYKEAVELFTGALEGSDTMPMDSPLYSLLLTERAEASLLNHTHEAALEDCMEAIDLKKDNMTAWTVKVEVYFALGRLQEARDELQDARKTWGAGNDTIEDAFKKTDFELRLQRADDDLRNIAAAVETGIVPDIPDGEPLHFNHDDDSKATGKSGKSSGKSKSSKKSKRSSTSKSSGSHKHGSSSSKRKHRK